MSADLKTGVILNVAELRAVTAAFAEESEETLVGILNLGHGLSIFRDVELPNHLTKEEKGEKDGR